MKLSPVSFSRKILAHVDSMTGLSKLIFLRYSQYIGYEADLFHYD